MEQLVRVREVYPDGTAQVACIRESACSGDCHKCSGCGAVKETVFLRADNPIGAAPGDLVNLRSETAPVLKAAVVLYLLPLAAFFAGYGIGVSRNSSGTLWGCLAFLCSIVFIVFYDRRVAKKNTSTYTITGFAAQALPGSKKRGS